MLEKPNSKFLSQLTKRILHAHVVDVPNGKFRGIVRTVADMEGKLGMIYGGTHDGRIRGRWCYVTWKEKEFSEFLKEMAELFPNRPCKPFPPEKIDAIVRHEKGRLEEVSVRLGFGRNVLREFRGGRSPTRVATRILKEAYDKATNATPAGT